MHDENKFDASKNFCNQCGLFLFGLNMKLFIIFLITVTNLILHATTIVYLVYRFKEFQ